MDSAAQYVAFDLCIQHTGKCVFKITLVGYDKSRTVCEMTREEADEVLARFVAMRSLMDVVSERLSGGEAKSK